MIYKVIYVDDGLKKHYENAKEIIVSWYGISDFDNIIVSEINRLVDNHKDAKILFINLKENLKKQTKLSWPNIKILER